MSWFSLLELNERREEDVDADGQTGREDGHVGMTTGSMHREPVALVELLLVADWFTFKASDGEQLTAVHSSKHR